MSAKKRDFCPVLNRKVNCAWVKVAPNGPYCKYCLEDLRKKNETNEHPKKKQASLDGFIEFGVERGEHASPAHKAEKAGRWLSRERERRAPT